MPVDLVQYRQAVGSFAVTLHSKGAYNFQIYIILSRYCCLYPPYISIFLSLLLLCSGDIHPNPGPCNDRNLKIIHLNVRSLKDVIHAEFLNYDVICLTETWLYENINDSDILIPGYHSPFRKDRLTRGGGVAIYVKEYLCVESMVSLDVVGLEALWVKIKCKTRNYLIGTFYRADKTEQYWDLIDQSIEMATDLNIFTVIVGDLNIDVLNEPNSKIETLKRLYGIHQIIDTPTRITHSSSTLIDLILCHMKTACLVQAFLTPFAAITVRSS